jgi:glutathione-regulated potassium-efflux system ancillary protein KefG
MGGNALAGKPVIFAITTGGIADAYRADGHNKFTMNELLAPYIATANMTKMIWNEPFVVHGVRTLTDQELADAAAAYQELLTNLAG